MIRMPLVFLAIAAVAAGCGGLPEGIEKGDMKLVQAILRQDREEGKHTIVDPRTSLGFMSAGDSEEIGKTRAFLKEKLATTDTDCDFGPLVDALFRVNKESVVLGIPSDRENGYALDKDGTFRAYFEEDGGGWEKWHEEHPEARGMTSVSLPVVDRENSLVLVYKGTQVHWLAGAGFVIAYRLKDGELQEIARVMVWIS